MSVMYLITRKTIIRICWIAINLSCLTFALKDVYVTIPTAVKRGDNANLTCHYDLENDTLYSIKWYKGKREFYRYTPKEEYMPMKVFPVASIRVERSMSNASNVMLTSMKSGGSGKYSCEVSADAPSFHTVIVTGEMEVVDLPIDGPEITINDKMYRIGDILQANCSLNDSKPSANLTWFIINYAVMPHQIIRYNVTKNLNNNNNNMENVYLETSVIGLKLVLTPRHFRSKFLRLGCNAKIYDIYENSTEKLIELEANNQILGDDFSTIGSSRHTQYDNDFVGGVGDPYDIKMHHIQASPDMSSSSSRTLSISLLIKAYSTFLITTITIKNFIYRISSSLSFAVILINWLKFLKNFIIKMIHHHHYYYQQQEQQQQELKYQHNNQLMRKINFEEFFKKILIKNENNQNDVDYNNISSNISRLPLKSYNNNNCRNLRIFYISQRIFVIVNFLLITSTLPSSLLAIVVIVVLLLIWSTMIWTSLPLASRTTTTITAVAASAATITTTIKLNNRTSL